MTEPRANEFSGRTVLVTGGSSGIGRACALAFGQCGANVLVNYYSDKAAADDVVKDITSRGGQAIAHQADVADEADVAAMMEALDKSFGRLDILVNNAGIQKDAPFLDMSLADWRAVIETNLQGQFLCSRAAARTFLQSAAGPEIGRKAAGNIICMSSVHDTVPWSGHANYAASKAGTVMLMKTLAQELGAAKIRVNAVAPGAIKTDINRDAWEDEDARRDLCEKIPYGRIGEPDDVAKVVLWLASDDSDYVHGQVLYVDGGMMLYPEFREGG